MRQHTKFVPYRLSLALLAVLAFAVAKPFASTNVLFAGQQDEQIDPIITGQTVSEPQLDDWESRKAKFEECGLCGDAQPFPDDLPQ